MSSIVFATSVFPDAAILHASDTFHVQWKALNAGPSASPGFRDRLVVSAIPEGCPGSDNVEYAVVYDSDNDGSAEEFQEPALTAGAEGRLMQAAVGPFPAGFYRLTVLLDVDGGGASSFNCVEIQ